MYNLLKQQVRNVSIYDPNASAKEIKYKYDIDLIDELKKYDGIILAVGRSQFRDIKYKELKKNTNSVLFDVKSFLNKENVDARL